MKTAVIIDDEYNACEFIEELLKRYYAKEILMLKSFTDALEALDFLNSRKVDLVFLDIQMPDLNGIELLLLTAKKGFDVIFTTAYSEHAIEALRLKAFDYLVKPINVDEFRASVDRYLSQNQSTNKASGTHAKNLSLSINANLNRKIAIHHQTAMEVVFLYDILYCLADENYSMIVLFDGRTIKLSKPLKTVESEINSSAFYRCHKSYLVNLHYVSKYNRTQQTTELIDGTSIPVSHRKKDDFVACLQADY